MDAFPKPIVYISKCLGFAHCRYDGQMIENSFVERLKEYVEFHAVCPEVEIGLGIPRKPIRIVSVDEKHHLYQPSTGKDVTQEMEDFADRFLSGISEVDGFLLKNRSPSCGPQDVKIYSGFENVSRTFRSSGFYGGEAVKRFHGMAIEDEGRIRNFAIREDFLTKLFTFARFREAKKQTTLHALMEFHSRHKLMLMGYNQSQMRLMGKILANHENSDLQSVTTKYEEHLKLALAKPPRVQSIINVLQHAFGGFSNHLSSEEKQFFLESLEEYRDERIPLSALLHVLRAWAIQYKNSYLLNQSFMNPYPKSLVEITDSGKGRRL
ncbi:cytoplasmic protein [candidate division KSB3 bacterium]|uniref:Cytoplasmic protein n=1 Tax=candidate division KSB3 bacterium TaxID=2044937 RepID=A0A2G6K8S5_9BACT|nr:MAG: cytoplasmic protein [candidate division KSB3 bacterium]